MEPALRAPPKAEEPAQDAYPQARPRVCHVAWPMMRMPSTRPWCEISLVTWIAGCPSAPSRPIRSSRRYIEYEEASQAHAAPARSDEHEQPPHGRNVGDQDDRDAPPTRHEALDAGHDACGPWLVADQHVDPPLSPARASPSVDPVASDLPTRLARTTLSPEARPAWTSATPVTIDAVEPRSASQRIVCVPSCDGANGSSAIV